MDGQQPVPLTIVNAVMIIDEKPHLELTGNQITVRIGATDSKRFLCVHLRPYTPAEMKAALKALKVRVLDAGTSLLQEEANPAALRHLCDLTFTGLSHVRLPDGSEPTKEQQRAWLDRNPGMKHRIANDAFAQIVILADNAPASGDDDLFELTIGGNAGASVHYVLHGLADMNGNAALVDVRHHFEPDTENDFQIYERASRREIDKSSGSTAIDVDYEALGSLYDRTITSVEGMVVNGEPATPYNKAKWIPLVPFWQKVISLSTRFDAVLKKNIG